MERQLTLKHEGLELAATLHYPAYDSHTENTKDSGKKQAIIICHGFVGSRIGVDRLFVKTARSLAAQGNYVIRFDYGGCGESNGDYGALGFDSMVDQTRTIIDYISDMECVDPRRIVLLGHSLGGAVALMTSVKDKRVKRLVLWSPVAYPFNDIVRIVGRDSYDEAIKTGSTDHVGYSLKPVFFDSLMQHQPFQSATRFGGEVYIVHGTSDDLIPVDYSFLYQKVFWTRSEGLCDKEIIFQANHTYSSSSHQEEAIRVTSEWLSGLDRKQQDWHHWSI
ncbi:alpha/beta fold hydrolase [Paenibacillus sp. GSMTC-2017]|uniref:alpha/beta hydrolase n=1 Tax=Paenibacillus sp. GSMTC-2017 TaxID=2794350 RepID=UPI0018D99BEB|nr:alpha/beta hydrolase [Paenibacillus sp. GSMTC-2017]MBH5319014.1 alpha/beta fold hydrolase [Paenibacillus sp. GSMTC-2017]